MNWTKASLQKAIEEARIGVDMTAKILTAVKEFEHYAQVNKRFIDRLKELGCHGYIQKDKWSTTLCISMRESWDTGTAEFRYYVSHCFSKSTLTWEGIKNELEKCDFSQRLENAKERLEIIDNEVAEAKELLEILKSKKFKCFDFYKGIYEMEDAIRHSSR